MVPGVAHVEIDAEDHLALVRELDIRRTPTVLFLDQQGRQVKHASGLPRKATAHRALDDIRESIDELRFYRQHLFIPSPATDATATPAASLYLPSIGAPTNP